MARLRYTEDHWARRAPTDEHLAEYLARADTYNLTKVRLFERRLGDDLAGKRVLDYGGGAGFMAVRCAERGAQVTLVDAEPTALETAKLLATKRGVEDRIRTICSERFPRELFAQRFEVVILKDVVEHIPDDVALLRSLARCPRTTLFHGSCWAGAGSSSTPSTSLISGLVTCSRSIVSAGTWLSRACGRRFTRCEPLPLDLE